MIESLEFDCSSCILRRINVLLIRVDTFKNDHFLYKCNTEGMTSMPHVTMVHRKKAYELLKEDADKILRLIEVQMDNLTMPQCPLYEEVLDTQMFGLSREIDFAVRLNLITEEDGRKLIENLEKKLNILHESAQKALHTNELRDIKT